ncbi:MAG: Si-specific NAD(P)(+) transhydrogenase [Planctomycetes bacterium]|nr:Si-specific NAD(P)(+) transhydrogenase [Planctomycetota bacterium]
MTLQRFDLVVLGAGPAGLAAAIEAGRLGRRVCVVERERELGGAGLNTGTIPSKTLRETALHYSGALQRGLYGVDFALKRERIPVERFMVRKEQVLASEHELLRRELHDRRVQVVHGNGCFLDAHTVEVRGGPSPSPKAADPLRLAAEHVLVATGSSPRRPPGFPFEDPDVVDSDTILALDRIPESMTVVGGGVIGCEYASIFGALGVPVTLIEEKREILGFLDDEITRILRERMQRLGVRFLFEDAVERVIDEPGPGVGVVTRKGQKFRAGKLLVAAGRTGNVVGIGLETIGVKVDDKQRIVVDDRFRTSVPSVLAAGDVLGFPGLASTSMEQGRLAMQCLFGACDHAELARVLPYGLYTIPEVGTIGVTEKEAREKHLDAVVGRAWYRENARGQIVGDVFGLLKLVVDRRTRKLLGVHIVGERATELVHLGQAVMELGGTADYLARSVMNFPTLSVLYKRAALNALGAIESTTATA